MTAVTVRTFGHLTAIVGSNQVGVEFPGTTVGDLLEELIARYGDAMRGVLYPRGSFSELMCVLVNGRNMSHLGGPATILKDGDIVSVLPITAGG
jgi:molybdopterin synthase sulfur carrier subunit